MSDFISTFDAYEKKVLYLEHIDSLFEDQFWNNNDKGCEEFYLKSYNETIQKIHHLIEKYQKEFMVKGIIKENYPFRDLMFG